MEQFAKETLPVSLEAEMRHSYLDYAMSVIVGRALPDVRDGLKPVHRRVLFAMHESNTVWNRPYVKCARVVGDVLGKYHPHGDSATYEALVRMVQDFSLRYPLIDGQGNFGSVDGDAPAAYRYTECRLEKITAEMLADIDKETVDFAPNYDGKELEPTVLPTRIPNLLVNGSSGIAVGMATNIPPHNLTEIITACLTLLDNPDTTVDELIEHVPAPDFPTAGIIFGTEGVREGYRTGRGRVVIRARTHIEDLEKGGRQAIIVDELPYQVNKATLLTRIGELVREKKLDGISDLRDESDKSGMRVVIELKRGEVTEIILNNLYKLTQLQDSFGMNMVALVDGQPRLLNLKQFLEFFLQHRREIVVRRTRFELRKARDRGHILEGLAVALSNVDEIIALIKAAATPAEAKAALMARTWRSALVEEMLNRSAADAARPEGLAPEYGWQRHGSPQGYRLSEAQAQAILELRLQRLTGLEQEKITGEYREVMVQIVDLLDVLAKPARVTTVIGDELKAIRDQFGDKLRDRRAQRRPVDRGPYRARRDGGHAVARRLHEGAAGRRVSRAAPRRPGQAGDRNQGRRFHRPPVHRQHARFHPLLFQPRARVLAQGVQRSSRRPHLARQADRQPGAVARAREDHRDPAGQGVRQRPLRVHGDGQGDGQEDAAVRFFAAPSLGHHRGRSRRRRLPGRRGADRRQARRHAVQLRRQGGALRGR
jgi:DNA gyrase subunit A